jgi:hypothetical protein
MAFFFSGRLRVTQVTWSSRSTLTVWYGMGRILQLRDDVLA